LNCNIGDRTGWLGVRTIGDDEVIDTVVQGYAADRAPTGRQWVSEDKLRTLWQLKGFYQNDTFGGTSGAPVFGKDSKDTVIGVHTNGLHGAEEPWKSNNAFTRITSERLALIQQWISD
jgi:putative chitinase